MEKIIKKAKEVREYFRKLNYEEYYHSALKQWIFESKTGWVKLEIKFVNCSYETINSQYGWNWYLVPLDTPILQLDLIQDEYKELYEQLQDFRKWFKKEIAR